MVNVGGHHVPYASALQIRDWVQRGELSAVEVVQSVLDRIDGVNPGINAVVTTRPEKALEEAERIDERRDNGERPLTGVPITIKDNVDCDGLPTSYGSRLFRDSPMSRNATIVQRLQAAGAIVVGKTNLPEFALLPHTMNGFYGKTVNPWCPGYTSGGSSGGAAAAVAAGMGPVAHGNDGGGSCRIPASCCGVVGLKPTRGRVPWGPGKFEVWGGLATNGVLTRTVRDAALALDVMSGAVVGDPYALPEADESYLHACDRPAAKRRIAFTTTPPHGEVDPQVGDLFIDAVKTFAEEGHSMEEASPDLRGLFDIRQTILATHVTVQLDEMHVRGDQLADLTSNTLELWGRGLKLSAFDYARAVSEMRKRSAEIMAFWEDYDLLLTPTLTRPPPSEADCRAMSSIESANLYPFTYEFNMTGQPAISIPCGWTHGEGLPVGLQIVGRFGDEAAILGLAAEFEERRPWADRVPPLIGGERQA